MRDRPQTTAFWRGHLPHWEVVDGRYFVTIRLRGALPEAGARRVRELSARYRAAVANGQESLRLRLAIFLTMERWLHTSTQVDHLVRPAVAAMVTDAINHRTETRTWRVYGYVLMPNHLHMFIKVLQDSLKSTLESFKTWTGGQAAGLLGGSRRRFWQHEWFDHWSRSAEEDEGIRQYIQQNPVKAGLVPHYSEWPHASWAPQ